MLELSALLPPFARLRMAKAVRRALLDRTRFAVREVVRCHRDLGLRGVSMDPYMHKIPADHRLFYPIYAKCVELDIPCVLTAGWAFRMPGVVVDDAAPRHVAGPRVSLCGGVGRRTVAIHVGVVPRRRLLRLLRLLRRLDLGLGLGLGQSERWMND